MNTARFSARAQGWVGAAQAWLRNTGWRRSFNARAQCWAGAILLAALTLTPLRAALESAMSTQMLIQFPALMLAGALLSAAVPAALRRWLAPWNALGISGLVAIALALAVLMIPRVLDLVLVDIRVEAAKIIALLLCGALLRHSWRMGGLLIQAFFLGNMLPMMGVAGWLYQSAPQRLCNAYLLDDQQQLGQGLIWLSVAIALIWLTHALRQFIKAPALPISAKEARSD